MLLKELQDSPMAKGKVLSMGSDRRKTFLVDQSVADAFVADYVARNPKATPKRQVQVTTHMAETNPANGVLLSTVTYLSNVVKALAEEQAATNAKLDKLLKVWDALETDDHDKETTQG